jgi:7-cyano-7-deazaguanine synthase
VGNPDVVLIYSGGMDSTTLLYHLLAEGLKVHALGINYGQRHRKELKAAIGICEKVNVPYEVADLTAIRHFLGGSSQTDDAIPVPEGHYAEESMKITVVPNRNMLMLSVAIARAISLKAHHVAYGPHKGDHAIYPDCRPDFIDAMKRTALLADWHAVVLLTPFIEMTKADIAVRGRQLGVPFAETWSCYKGGDLHCGKCGTCVERIEAFQLGGVEDPTPYFQTVTEGM